jgi:prevent-host-death family protein
MTTVNMLQAKNSLSSLVERVASGRDAEIVIARHGKPAARLVPLRDGATGPGQRLGVARDAFTVPDSIDTHAAEVAALFNGRPAEPGQAG